MFCSNNNKTKGYKLDRISFKSIQNVGGSYNVLGHENANLRVVLQLNEEETKDFSKYKDVFDKFPDKTGKGFLRFDENVAINGGRMDIDNFFINGKLLEPKIENSNLLVKIYDLLDKIREKAIIDRDLNQHIMLPITQGYFDSLECLNNYSPDKKVINSEGFYKSLRRIHDSTHVEACSAMLMQYFKTNFKNLR